MSGDHDLLRKLREALADADVDVGGLVEEAWSEAHQEVRETLRRMMTQDLLARAMRQIQRDRPPLRHEPETAEPRGRPASETEADVEVSGDDGAGHGTSSYVFGVGDTEVPLPPDPPRLPGGGPLRRIPEGRVAAVVCDVDPSVLSRINDPGPESFDLLVEAAQTHDGVLARIGEAGTVLPLQLGTVLPDDASVSRLLADHEGTLAQELARVDGHGEWAVTVHAVPRGESVPERSGPSSGREYLERRKADLRKRRGADDDQALIHEIHQAFAERASGAQRVEERPVEEAEPPLFHGVYLVRHDEAEHFRSAGGEFHDPAVNAEIRVTGPWPPYHFTAVDLAGNGGRPHDP